MLKIVFYGNFSVDYCSEVHYSKTLKSMGHEVVELQETTVKTEDVLEQALKADVFVWVHSHGFINQGSLTMEYVLEKLKENNIPLVAYHLDLYMPLDRWKEYENSPYMKVEHFFTVDKLMADWFNKNTNVKGHYLQAGVFEQECRIANMPKEIDVMFVGSKGYHKEWPYRPQLINWLKENYRLFRHVGGDGDIKTTRGQDLNRLYGYSKVAVGDTLCINYDYPYYWSDRVYETLGRGGFLIHPYIQGMEDHFEDGKHLVFYEYGDFKQLKYLIDYYIENNDEREMIRLAGHEHVKKNHTYTNRWQTIIKEIGL